MTTKARDVEEERVERLLLADQLLMAQLHKRDGILPVRPNNHGDARTCPYYDIYDEGFCPWCRQAHRRPLLQLHRRRHHRAA